MKKLFLMTAVTFFLIGGFTHLANAAETVGCYRPSSINLIGDVNDPWHRTIEIQEEGFFGKKIQVVFSSSEIESKIFKYLETELGMTARNCFAGYLLNPTTMIVHDITGIGKDQL